MLKLRLVLGLLFTIGGLAALASGMLLQDVSGWVIIGGIVSFLLGIIMLLPESIAGGLIEGIIALLNVH